MSLIDLFFDPFSTVPGSSLNWSQHAALQAAASRSTGSTYVTIDTTALAWQMHSLGRTTEQLVRAVQDLEQSVGLRLDAQTEQLTRQADRLDEIAALLRQPRHTRAAEQLRDASTLLTQHRYERALAAALKAVEDNPTDPHTFTAAGWAYHGLQRPNDARAMFREAAQASANTSRDMDAVHVQATVLAARLTFALEGPARAYTELSAGNPGAPKPFRNPEPLFNGGSMEEFNEWEDLFWAPATLAYDRAVYAAQRANPSSNAVPEHIAEVLRDDGNRNPARRAKWEKLAAGYLDRACRTDARCAAMALTDPLLGDPPSLREAAFAELQAHDKLVAKVLNFFDVSWRTYNSLVALLSECGALDFPEMAPFLNPNHPAFATNGYRLYFPRPDYAAVRESVSRQSSAKGRTFVGVDRWFSTDLLDRFFDTGRGVLVPEAVLANVVAKYKTEPGLKIIDKDRSWIIFGYRKKGRFGGNSISIRHFHREDPPPDWPSYSESVASYNRASADSENFYLADGRRVSRRFYEGNPIVTLAQRGY